MDRFYIKDIYDIQGEELDKLVQYALKKLTIALKCRHALPIDLFET